MPKIPPRYGPPSNLGSKPASSKMMGRNNDLRFSLRLAEIIRVDYEQMLCDLEYIQGESPAAEEVPISAAYWSKRGFLGAMPEVGSIAIVGFTASHQDRATRPLILSFLPNGFKTALRFDPFGAAPRNSEELEVPTEVAQTELKGIYGVDRRKMRKIYPGTVYGMSDKGSELILDSGVRLFDRSGSEFMLRDADSAGILTVNDLYTTTAAGRSRTGRVVRDGLNVPSDFLIDGKFPLDHPLFDELADAGIIFDDGSLVSDVNGLPSVTLPDGRKTTVITENLEDPNDITSRAFTEQRTEIQEFSDGLLPFSDAHGFDADVLSPEAHYHPFIERVSGTVVGNDPYTSQGRTLYGQLLKPVLFNEPSSTAARPRMEPIENSESETEKSLAAASLYRMRRPDGLGELFLAHDKEGHVFLSIPASTSKKSNLGAGRSVEADIKGSTKLVMGADKNDNVSMDLTTSGGLKWTLGSVSSSKRSLDLRTGGGVALDVRGSDINGDAVKMTTSGNVAMAVEGTYGIAATGDHLEEISGKKDVAAESVSMKVGTGNYTLNVLSDHDTNVQGERTATLGEGDNRTILTGGENTKIVEGDSDLTMVAPASRNVTFAAAGTHKIQAGGALTVTRQAGLSGDYTFRATTGSYSVTLGGGSISLTAGAGNVNISPAGVTITGPQISLNGTVGLGTATAPNAVIGGVPGPSPHLDYVTGIPLKGNPQVRTM